MFFKKHYGKVLKLNTVYTKIVLLNVSFLDVPKLLLLFRYCRADIANTVLKQNSLLN